MSDPAEQSSAAELLTLARQLERGCRELAESLTALLKSPEDRFEESCRHHVAATEALRAQISAAAGALQTGSGSPSLPSSSEQGELRAALAGSHRFLEDAARAYACLAGKASVLRDQAGQELLDIRRAGQVLRTYQRSSHPAR